MTSPTLAILSIEKEKNEKKKLLLRGVDADFKYLQGCHCGFELVVVIAGTTSLLFFLFFSLSLTIFPQLAPAVTTCVVDLNANVIDLTWQRWVFVVAT